MTLFLILLGACAIRPHSAEAEAIQAEALQTGESVAPQLQDLDQRRISLEIQGRALRPEEIAFIGEVRSLSARFEEWQKSKPGMRGKSKDMLRNQKNYLREIRIIKERAAALLRSDLN